MIRRTGSKFTVSLRQQLTTADEVEQFCEELSKVLEAEVRAGRTPAFDDFDLSQTGIGPEGFEEIFLHLIISEAHVERFKAFGCPALNDAAASSLADWLARANGEAMPSEVHLSDCAITSEGFEALATALEENEALPVQDPRDPKRAVPLYVRLERNYIEEAALRAKAQEGAMATWKKSDPIPQEPGIKWRLVVWESGQFGQHRGAPPAAPRQAPARVAASVVAPKVRSQGGKTAEPAAAKPAKGSPALAKPGTRQPGVLLPSASAASAVSKRVMAPKLPQAVPPPQLAASMDAEQPEDEEAPPEQSVAKPIRPPKQLAATGPRKVAPKIAQAQPPAGPPPVQAPKAVPKQVAPPKRPPAPRPALMTSSTKAAPPTAKIEEDEIMEDDGPQPPRSPPPSTLRVMPAREKMIAAPKCKVRAKPY